MATFNIRFADDELRRFENMVGALGPEKARAALARAVNRVTDMVETATIRAIVRQSSVPRRLVKQNVYTSKAAHKGTGPIQGLVIAKGFEVPLKELGARQFPYGVRAKVRGKFTRFPSTFIFAGTYTSGKEVAGGHVLQRVGKKRRRQRGSGSVWVQPFEKVPSGIVIADELVKEQSLQAYEQIIDTKLAERAMHELSRLLQA